MATHNPPPSLILLSATPLDRSTGGRGTEDGGGKDSEGVKEEKVFDREEMRGKEI